RRQHRPGVRGARRRRARRRHVRAGPVGRSALRVQDRDREGRSAQSREGHRRDQAECARRLAMRALNGQRPAAFALACGLVLALGGCSTWNPLVAVGIMSEPANKPVALAPIKSSLSPRLAWQLSVGKAQGFVFRPAIFERRVYAIDAEGELSIVDEDTGRSMLKVDLKKKLSGGVEVGDGKV